MMNSEVKSFPSNHPVDLKVLQPHSLYFMFFVIENYYQSLSLFPCPCPFPAVHILKQSGINKEKNHGNKLKVYIQKPYAMT